MNKKKYLAKNTILLAISSFGSKLLSFFLIPLYTNVLSTSDYGYADIISTTVSLLIYLFTINIADGVLRFAIEKHDSSKSIVNFGLRVFSIGSLVLSVFVFVFSEINFLKWEPYFYLFLFLLFIVQGLYSIFSNYFRAIDKVSLVAFVGIFSTIVTIASNIILLLWVRIGLIGYFIALNIGPFASCLIYMCFYFKQKNSDVAISNETKVEIIKYSLPLIFNGIAWWVNSSIDKYFIIYLLGSSENGIYSVASKLASILTIIQTIFTQAWTLSAIKDFDSYDKDNFIKQTHGLYYTALVIMCSLLVLFSIPLAKILYAKDFFVAWKYSPILVFSVLFSALSGFIGSLFSALKNSKIFAISTVVAAIINCILNFVLIPVWGLYGAAIATVISFFIIWIIRLICLRKYVSFKLISVIDIISFCILICQIIFNELDNHYYTFQSLLFLLLLGLNYERLKTMFVMLISIFKRRKNHEN